MRYLCFKRGTQLTFLLNLDVENILCKMCFGPSYLSCKNSSPYMKISTHKNCANLATVDFMGEKVHSDPKFGAFFKFTSYSMT